MNLIFRKCVLLAFVLSTSSVSFAQEVADDLRPTALVCNFFKVADVDTFVIEGALRQNVGHHTKYWSITNSKGKVWALVDLTPNQNEAIAEFENRKVSATVKCAGQNSVDQVQIADIKFTRPL